MTAKPNSVLEAADIRRVVDRYRKRIAQHGVTLESLETGGAAKQEIRHKVHAEALRGPRPSILDIGCGLGYFYRHLNENGRDCAYHGYDIVPEYISACREMYPEASFEVRNIFEQGIEGTYDTVAMSQVLNNRYRDSDNWRVLEAALKLGYEHARESVSIDMMSTYVDYQNPDLFYYEPEEAFRIAKSVCRRVVLRHDYRPYEFCLQLYREKAGGYEP